MPNENLIFNDKIYRLCRHLVYVNPNILESRSHKGESTPTVYEINYQILLAQCVQNYQILLGTNECVAAQCKCLAQMSVLWPTIPRGATPPSSE